MAVRKTGLVVVINDQGYEQVLFRIAGGRVWLKEKYSGAEREVGVVEHHGDTLRFTLPLSRIE